MWQQRLIDVQSGGLCRTEKRGGPALAPSRQAWTATDKARPDMEHGPSVAWVEELDRLGTVDRGRKVNFFHPDFKYINDCGHFDYQRQRVYVRLAGVVE